MSNLQCRKQQFGSFLRRINGPAWLIACACVLGSWVAFATPASPGFVSKPLGPTAFEALHVVNAGDANIQIKTKGDVDVWIVTNTVSPGAHSGWHTHPGPSLVTVQSGTATYYEGDDPNCAPQRVRKGEGFVDEGGGHVHLVRNEGAEDLVLIATQILPVGAPRRIDAPAPLHCPPF